MRLLREDIANGDRWASHELYSREPLFLGSVRRNSAYDATSP